MPFLSYIRASFPDWQFDGYCLSARGPNVINASFDQIESGYQLTLAHSSANGCNDLVILILPRPRFDFIEVC